MRLLVFTSLLLKGPAASERVEARAKGHGGYQWQCRQLNATPAKPYWKNWAACCPHTLPALKEALARRGERGCDDGQVLHCAGWTCRTDNHSSPLALCCSHYAKGRCCGTYSPPCEPCVARTADAGPSRPVQVVHIPKTAGTSISTDLARRLDIFIGAQKPGRDEICLNQSDPSRFRVMMFRHPRAHVLSMFTHCAASAFARQAFRSRWSVHSSGDLQCGFVAWLQCSEARRNSSTPGKKREGLCGDCYDPWNMQSRYLSCPTAHPLDPGASTRALDGVDAVGLVEHYTLSLCLIQFRLTGAVPKDCFCDEAPMKLKTAHISHHAANHSIADFTAYFGTIDAMTAVDRAVYSAAKERFLADVREMKTRAGRPVSSGAFDHAKSDCI